MIKEFEEYLKRKGLSERTISNYNQYCRYYEQMNGSINEIDQNKVNKYLNKYNTFLSRALIKNIMDFLDKPYIKIPKQTGTKKLKVPKYITKEEINQIMDAMPSTRNKLMVAITFQAGLREDELMHIKINDFKWSKWTNNPGDAGELIVIGKGKKERMVFISPIIMKEVYDYVQTINIKKERLFNIGSSRWRKILYKTSFRAINNAISPHVLRHSTASYLLDKGWDIKQIQEYLGHQSLATTEIYLHINKKDLKNIFENSF